jgi:hypothetical protein
MATRHESIPHLRLRSTLGVLLGVGMIALALTLILVSRGTSAATATEPEIDISAEPMQLSPGDTLAIKVHITNPFTATLDRVVVRLSYDSKLLTPIGSSFNRDSDWVSDLNGSSIALTFRDISADKTRTGKAIFRVKQPQPGNTSVTMRARYHWYLVTGTGLTPTEGTGTSGGEEPLIVAPDGVLTDPNVIDSVPRTSITPAAGPTGTFFRAYASGFTADEGIAIWLNTPGGVADIPHELWANASGEVWPEFASGNLVPGGYGLVIYGKESTQTLVIPFTVTAASAAPASPGAPGGAPPPSSPRSQTSGLQFNIEPKSAATGAQFHAYGSGFANGEMVSIWINTPAGVRGIDGGFAVNSAGEVWPEFSSDGLAPGSYTLVIYGNSSGHTLVVPFSIS